MNDRVHIIAEFKDGTSAYLRGKPAPAEGRQRYYTQLKAFARSLSRARAEKVVMQLYGVQAEGIFHQDVDHFRIGE